MTGIARNFLVVGLGNPGGEYANTRHNVGFMAVDFLTGPDAVWKKEKNYLVTKSDGVIFIKPETFMNLSGLAVSSAMTKYRVTLENVTVIHDDIDLHLGTVRVKTGGGNAGHNGLKSIDTAIGRDYRRIRIGIGRPENKDYEISDWVVGKFSKTECSVISDAVEHLPV